MTRLYKVIGSELSPFSVKVRSWFRFKGIDHESIVASAAARKQYEEYFRIPVIPVVVTPDNTGHQDSTQSSSRPIASAQSATVIMTYELPAELTPFGHNVLKLWVATRADVESPDKFSNLNEVEKTRNDFTMRAKESLI